MSEQWKPVSGYEGLYTVSDRGQVFSLARFVFGGRGYYWRKGRMLSQHVDGDGYCALALCKDGREKRVFAHRLVCHAFLGSPPEGHQSNHIDGDKENNSVDNLEWVTPAENSQHAFSTGLRGGFCGEKNGAAKLEARQVKAIRQLVRLGCVQAGIARLCSVSPMTISSIATGKAWPDAAMAAEEDS